MNATVVLAHGAMRTPWIFGPLRERFTARGVASRAVQLPAAIRTAARREV